MQRLIYNLYQLFCWGGKINSLPALSIAILLSQQNLQPEARGILLVNNCKCARFIRQPCEWERNNTRQIRQDARKRKPYPKTQMSKQNSTTYYRTQGNEALPRGLLTCLRSGMRCSRQ